VDLPRSLSRSLPGVATGAENAAIAEARRLLAAHDRAELMLQSGLYRAGADPVLDRAVSAFAALDAFIAQASPGVAESFEALASALGRDGHPLAADLRRERQARGEEAPAQQP
jgi:flagellum-specific ATP synthase